MDELDQHLDPTSEVNLTTVKKKAVKGILFLTSRTFLLQIISLIATFLLTIFLDPAQYGTFFLVSAVVNFFAYFSDVGFSAALIQKKESLTTKDLKTAFSVQQLLVILLMILIFGLTPLLQYFYHIGTESIYLLWALAFSLLLSSLKTIPSIILERRLDFGKLIIPQLAEALVFNISAVYFAWQGYGLNSFTIAVLLRGLVGLILMYIIQPWKPALAFSKESFQSLFRYGLPYQGNTFLAMIKDDGMTAFLGGILGPAGIGLLGWAQKWAAAPLRFFMDQVIKVTFPAYSRMQDNKQALSQAVNKSIFFICLIVFPSLGLLITLAPILTQLIPRYSKWQPALLALMLISINIAWAAVTTPLTNLLNAIGKITLTFKLMLMWTGLSWILLPALAYLYGLNGAALAYALIGTSSIIAIKITTKYVNLNLMENIFKPLFSTILMIITIYLADIYLESSWLNLIILGILGVIVYLGAIFILMGKSLFIDIKKILAGSFSVIVILFFISSPNQVLATSQDSFVNIVNPVRGSDFWEQPNQAPITAVEGQINVLKKNNLPATFLLRFDVLKNQQIVNLLKDPIYEKGLFLEITPSLTSASKVAYHSSFSWHSAASAFLTGYSVQDRKKLIDTSFENFKQIFGAYPKSVGAWWIDATSLQYMQEKYQINSALIVADQYSTDNYQIWGQYWGTPYYPAKNNALFPAQTRDNKIDVVITQWAARDPVNGYGKGVEESTYSVQANDYIDYHQLDTNYFSKLVDIYTNPGFNQFGQIIVGLENSYSWSKYNQEYENQIKVIAEKKAKGQISVNNLTDFSQWYKRSYPQLSPEHIIVSDDPLGSNKKAVWFMNNYYRTGWYFGNEGSVIRDLRQYVTGQDEICLETICESVNFATFATRVLDEVTNGLKITLDEGTIGNFAVNKVLNNYSLKYLNQQNLPRDITFLPRDLSINGISSTIDGTILKTQQDQSSTQKTNNFNGDLLLKESKWNIVLDLLKFLGIVVLLVLIPGLVIIKSIFKEEPIFIVFNSMILGIVGLTIASFISNLILKNNLMIYIYGLIFLVIFLVNRYFLILRDLKSLGGHLITGLVILMGSVFLTIPTFRSGLQYGYGVGFWGPNTHDGVWHIALINQLAESVPTKNPILSGNILQNYHYFYDLFAALLHKLGSINIEHLIFLFLPFLLAFLLGLGTVTFIKTFFTQRTKAIWLGLYLVYFSGSFGWIPDFIKNKAFNGESAFWVNQAISFNLNPPFIISLLIVVSYFLLIKKYLEKKSMAVFILLLFLGGSLLEFKAYAAILVMLSTFTLGFIQLKKRRRIDLILLTLLIGFVSSLLFIPNYASISQFLSSSSGLFIFSPFWFIHSMVDSPDRLGLTRLTLMRESGLQSRNYFKFFFAEGLGLLIFILGNLGLRVFALGALINIKSVVKRPEILFIFVFCLYALMIPLIFIQVGTPWNTIQFFYYLLFFTAIASALVLTRILDGVPKFISYLMIGLVVILVPINSLVVAQGYFYPHPHAFISQGELAGLNFIAKQPKGIVLTYPYQEDLKNNLTDPLPLLAYDSTAYVSAFTKNPTFVEDLPQLQILSGKDLIDNTSEYKKRIIMAKDFFSGREKNWSIQFLASSNIKYIYLPKLYKLQMDINTLPIEQVYENEEVLVYEVVI